MEIFVIYSGHLEYFTTIAYTYFQGLWYIWYIPPRFGILVQEKSGNPDRVLENFWPDAYIIRINTRANLFMLL
jgi:hypothetical protein